MSLAHIYLSALLVSAAAPDEAARARRAIDAYAAPELARGDLSGQLLVFRGGRLLAERNWGYSDREKQRRVDAATAFNVASLTKPMTMVVTLEELEKKRLALGDSIARWLPAFPHADSITVEQLLRHRSGIPHEGVADSEMTRHFTSAEVVDRLARLPLDFPPGARSQYSSGGFVVLSRVLELGTGRPYGTLVEERIFAPLGMKHSWHAGEKPRAVAAIGYAPSPRGVERLPNQDFSALVGAGSVWSTAHDLHLFVQAIVEGKLGPSVRASLVRGGKLDFNGRVAGFKAYAVWDSSSSVEFEFVSNQATGAPDLLKEALPRLARGEDVAPPDLPALRSRGFTDQEMRRLSGVYRLENGTRLDVHAAGGALWCNDWLLVPTTGDTLFSPRDYGLILPVADSTGTVVRLDWVQRGTTYPAPRENR